MLCTDSVVERRALRDSVFPRFREHCRHSLGLDVRVSTHFTFFKTFLLHQKHVSETVDVRVRVSCVFLGNSFCSFKAINRLRKDVGTVALYIKTRLLQWHKCSH